MKIIHYLSKVSAIEVDINFGSSDGLVAEHELDGAQIGAIFEQVGSKRMSEGMGADGFVEIDSYS